MSKRSRASSDAELLGNTSAGSEAKKKAITVPQQKTHKWLAKQAFSHIEQFDATGQLQDINAAIEYLREATSLVPRNHRAIHGYMHELGGSLRRRFECLGDTNDIEEAVKHGQHALLPTPEGDPDMSTRLDSLGLSLQSRFERLGDLVDLDKAIEHHQRAVSVTPEGHPDMPIWLNNLGRSLQFRFESLGNLVDLDKAIEHHQHAVSVTPEGHPHMPARLSNLGRSLQFRFESLGNLVDLDKAIEHHQRAVSVTPEGHPHMPAHLSNLGRSLQFRFESLGNLVDLDKAIEHHQRAVSVTPEGHPGMPTQLSNLGRSLQSRFERLGNLVDLDKAIEHQQHAVSATPEGHPHMPIWLSNLGHSLQFRFERLGNLVDLDKAIEHQQNAVSVTPEGHPRMPIWLSNLGSSLQSRFERLGNLVDLDKAIEHHQRAVSVTPEGHPHMPIWLSNLGRSLRSRFERLGNLVDLDKAIEHQQHAVSVTPEGHPRMPIWLSNLGYSLQSRFERLGTLADLDKAIEHKQRAVSVTPEGHPNMPIWLSHLGGSLRSRFEFLGELPQLAGLFTRYTNTMQTFLPTLTDDTCNLHQAVLCYQNAALSATGYPHDRFEAALQWAAMCDDQYIGSSLDAYTQAMVLLPQLVWIGGTIGARYRDIVGLRDACAEAVSGAIAKEYYHLALEWLEEGRSIVWRQVMQLRTPFDEISAFDSKLAAELTQVAYDLDHASSVKPMGSATELLDDHSLDAAARRHRRLAERWEQLIAIARQISGLEGFMRPKQASELMHSSHTGAVVLLNIHSTRCDALVIRPNGTQISCVPLTQFSCEKAAGISTQMSHMVRSRGLVNRGVKSSSCAADAGFERMLAVLWHDLVKPILSFLGYTRKRSGNDLPHITWCTTGPLSFLPIHAAGDYSSQDMVFDYVVSSYTPTLSALLPPSHVPSAFSGIVSVGQTSTPGMSSLPGTAVELDRIQERFQGLPATRLEGSDATPVATLAAMEEASWVHFACHASQDQSDPTKSAFYLHGGKLDLATITRKQLKYADLAFLSACQTATGDQALADEAVHLAAGMLTAGFRTVIATMWSIGDEDAPLIADKVYEHLLEGGTPDARRAAVAVHKATECLRAKVGVKEIVKWAPYIHIGL